MTDDFLLCGNSAYIQAIGLISANSNRSDHRLEDRIIQQLGESKQACVSIIELIEERLQDIESENSDFSAIVEQEREVSNIALR